MSLRETLDDLRDRADLDEDDRDSLTDDEKETLTALQEIVDEIGEDEIDNLIPESSWEEYAEDMAYDCGMVERDSTIASYIDWQRWAEDVAMDYTVYEIDGSTYYYRS